MRDLDESKEMQARQIAIGLSVIERYRKNQLSLNSMIGNLSGVSNFIELIDPKKCERAIIQLEIVNAVIIDRNTQPNESDIAEIDRNIAIVESIFENSRHLFFSE